MANGDTYIENRALSIMRDTSCSAQEAIAQARAEWDDLERDRAVIRLAMGFSDGA